MNHVRAKTILVVEDERIVAKDLQRSLVKLGYLVPATATSASDAIALAAESCPDLVLMDIRIGGGRDGIEAAGVLRARFDVPIVFLTAYADRETVARAAQIEPHGYLIKPVKPGELSSTIEIALYKHAMERKLRDRERWQSTSLGAIAEAVIATDALGGVTFMNRAAEQLVGLGSDQAVGRSLKEVLPQVDERDAGRPIATSLRGAEGEPSVEGRVAAIIDESGERLGSVTVLRDVSEQRRQQRRAAVADRLSSLSTLVAGVAHEINNPLSIVVANAQHMNKELASLQKLYGADGSQAASPQIAARLSDLMSMLADLRQGAERVRRVVAELTAFSRPEGGARTNVDLHDVIAWATRLTGGRVSERAQLRCELGAVPLVEADTARLGQVLLNLIENAIQATPEGAPGAHEIRLSTRTSTDGRAVLEVRDTGVGIAPEIAGRIFEPFFTTRDVGAGAGLGLSVCHGIVRSLGGEIGVESSIGHGSTFSVVLPPAAAPGARPGSSPGPGAPRGKVLVIDDEFLLVRAIRRMLAPEHDVTSFVDAEEALRHLAEHADYDLVLCDLMMPLVSGRQLYERLLAFAPALARRVVFMSGGAFTSSSADFLGSIDNRFLEKPFEPEGLRAFVRESMRAVAADRRAQA